MSSELDATSDTLAMSISELSLYQHNLLIFPNFKFGVIESEELIEDSNVGEATSDSFRLLLQCWTICCINVVDVFSELSLYHQDLPT